MRRNAVNDHLIVPPLVSDGAPLSKEALEEQPEPVRFADPEQIDPAFKAALSPADHRDEQTKKEQSREENRDQLWDERRRGETGNLSPDAFEQRIRSETIAVESLRSELQQADLSGKRRKRTWSTVASVLAVVIALLGIYEFTDLGQGYWHYFVRVKALKAEDVTAKSLKLSSALTV